jgi:electron transfer flavoprotein alpha subunit
MNERWIIVTDEKEIGPARAVFGEDAVPAALAVGDEALANKTRGAEVSKVVWIPTEDSVPVEAYARVVAEKIADDGGMAVAGANSASGRVLLGAIASTLHAASLSAITSMNADMRSVVRNSLDGRVLEELSVVPPVVVLAEPTGVFEADGSDAPLEQLTCTPDAHVTVERSVAEHASGLNNAQRVVSVGRGLKSKDDLGVIEALAHALGAEIACSMPVADDLGWIPKDHYVGRSGQQISPQLYMAVGISGAAQHLEGIRGARAVVAINNDPDASIFHRADYGIVGDLYEVVPALTRAIEHLQANEN